MASNRASSRTAAKTKAPKSAKAPKQWTVLVYMAGDNNLESFGRGDIAEMKRTGSTDAVNVVVQLDTLRAGKTRRYYLRKGTKIEADVVQSLGETDTGDPKVAEDFFRWGVAGYPAKHYLAIFWNHGSGIDETDVYRALRRGQLKVARKAKRTAEQVPFSRVRVAASRPVRRALFSTTRAAILGRRTRAIAYDDTSRDFLDNLELGKVVAQVAKAMKQKIDVLGFDACLMNMVEVAYQVRTSTQFVVGSQEVEPGDGWPYDEVIAVLAKKPGLGPRELGRAIVRKYAASYKADSVTQSAVDVGELEPLAREVDQLAGALLHAMADPIELNAIRGAAFAVQRFDLKDFVDLVDFCEELQSRSHSEQVKTCAKSAAAAAAEAIVEARAEGTGVERAHGLSIYFPSAAPDTTLDYARLDFARKTRWDEFLAKFKNS